ncbi:SpoIIE family protein phosphatase [Azospirillum thermophilum]|uniref:HAMP domain-containing protein n=1 Tax=Azospirillum thermophilum TaxID=2202148 RepID=A0A2S2CRE1_9PROT|nr:SpoIIE family protein phosphatase [Azospirillum thermophilum]AWK87084.1 hypothetical protein DEW08_13360 [Azospirillum thermophilum]
MNGADAESVRPAAGVRRGRSLLTRVGAVFLATTVAVGLAAVMLSAEIVGRQRHQDLLHRAGLVAATQADALSGPVWELDDRTAQSMIEALIARDTAIRSIAVFESSRSAPLAESALPPIGRAPETVTIERPILRRGHDGREERIGLLRLVYSTGEVAEATWNALVPVWGLLLLSLLTAVAVLALWLNRALLRPLIRLTQLSRAMTRGEYGSRIDIDRTDEIGVLAESFNRMAETVQDHTRTLEDRVRERTEALAQTNRAIMDSINYAQLIQSSILPAPDTLSEGLAEHFVLWRPRDVVSGDFYVCRPVGDGFVVGVADCTGHGVPGAFMTMTASAILNNVLDQMGADDPAAVLAAVDATVRATLHQGGAARSLTESFDNGLDLALCHVRPDGRRLVFAGARLPLLVVGPEGATEIRGDRHSLGYRQEAGAAPARFTNHAVRLRPGQTFYLGTDGLADQNGGRLGRSLGKRRLREVIARTAGESLDRQKEAVEELLAQFQADRAQRDDITLLGFRVRLAEAERNAGTGSTAAGNAAAVSTAECAA